MYDSAVCVVVTDLTEQKRSQEAIAALKQAEQLKDEFIGMGSHEIRLCMSEHSAKPRERWPVTVLSVTKSMLHLWFGLSAPGGITRAIAAPFVRPFLLNASLSSL
jgi:hypothetical protein